MRFAMFYHSLASDWNHGNAHFLRGVVSELLSRGHDVEVFEPRDGWSRQNLQEQHGTDAVEGYRSVYPQLDSTLYDVPALDLDRTLDGVDVVIAHEWNEPELIRRLGEFRRRHPRQRLLFHDTHHRIVTAPDGMRKYDLRYFDGVLAYGRVIRDIYIERGAHSHVWTWHEAADTRVFHPMPGGQRQGDLVWIGNWGDGERTDDLQEFLLDPIARLKLSAKIYGVRYPQEGQAALAAAGAKYCGWLPNHEAATVFSRFGVTVHIPRRPYREQLPGIPTIRVFEALACGIPLVTAPWRDVEGLFRPGKDYLVAQNGDEMRRLLRQVLEEPELADSMRRSGRETIRARHTCRHRVDELMAILGELGLNSLTQSARSLNPIANGGSRVAAPVSKNFPTRDARAS
jgi:spore maturation protein CgeB